MDLQTQSTDFVALVARFSLALFFLPSAIGKLTDQDMFVQGVLNYEILPEQVAKIFARVLPWVELFLSIALILGIETPAVGAGIFIILACFIAAVIINLVRGRLIPCNCHGLSGKKTIGWGTVARNVFLMSIAVTAVIFSSNVKTISKQNNFLGTNINIFDFTGYGLLFILLIVFCFVTIQLVEWSVDVYIQISHLDV